MGRVKEDVYRQRTANISRIIVNYPFLSYAELADVYEQEYCERLTPATIFRYAKRNAKNISVSLRIIAMHEKTEYEKKICLKKSDYFRGLSFADYDACNPSGGTGETVMVRAHKNTTFNH